MAMGFKVARVRFHGEVARLELERSENRAHLRDADFATPSSASFKKIGFRFVAIDLKGFRSGSLNEGVIAAPNIPARVR